MIELESLVVNPEDSDRPLSLLRELELEVTVPGTLWARPTDVRANGSKKLELPVENGLIPLPLVLLNSKSSKSVGKRLILVIV